MPVAVPTGHTVVPVPQFELTGDNNWPEDLQAERREFVVKSRRRGVLWDVILEQILTKFGRCPHRNVVIGQFQEDLRKHVKERSEGLEEVRELMIQRLDVALDGITDRVTQGSLDHIEVFLKLEQRRAKLTGADMPTQSEVTTNRGLPQLSEAQIVARMRELAQKLQARITGGVIDAEPVGENSSVQEKPDVTQLDLFADLGTPGDPG